MTKDRYKILLQTLSSLRRIKQFEATQFLIDSLRILQYVFKSYSFSSPSIYAPSLLWAQMKTKKE